MFQKNAIILNFESSTEFVSIFSRLVISGHWFKEAYDATFTKLAFNAGDTKPHHSQGHRNWCMVYWQ